MIIQYKVDDTAVIKQWGLSGLYGYMMLSYGMMSSWVDFHVISSC